MKPPFNARFQRDAAETAALPFVTSHCVGRKLAFHSLTLILLTVSFFTLPASACDLPVFRWALENWAADPYEIVVYHDGALSDAQQGLVDDLRAGTTERDGLGNAATTLVDTSKPMEPFFEDLLRGQESPELPWMVVRYPHALPNPSFVWSGPLSAAKIASLMDSPARQEIAKRLGEDATAVWVFLKTGDVKRDAGRREALDAALKAMCKTIEIKPLDIENNEDAEPVPWDLQFSFIDIDRNDPAEQPFIHMLLKSEGDLSGTDAPMAFPVFARGRALYALVDGGIAPDLIEEACMYIAGRCTCEVKDLNPGIDLLMSVNWDDVAGESMMTPIEPPSVAGLTAVELPVERMAETEEGNSIDVHDIGFTPYDSSAGHSGEAPSRTMIINIAIAMAVGFALVIAGTVYILFKTPNRNG